MKTETSWSQESVDHGLACFYLDDDLFAINIRLVREINPHLDITPTRTAPPYVSGLINLRGQIVTVIDLGERLGIGKREIGPKSRLVILKTNAELGPLQDEGLATSDDKIGVLVDRIADVITPEADDLEPPPPNLSRIAGENLFGVCKTSDHTVGILNPTQIIHYETRNGE